MQFRLTLKCTHCYQDLTEFNLDTALWGNDVGMDFAADVRTILEGHRQDCPYYEHEFGGERKKL